MEENKNLEEQEPVELNEVVEQEVEEQEEYVPFLSRKNLYSKIKVSVKTMDIIIFTLLGVLVLCLVLGIFVLK